MTDTLTCSGPGYAVASSRYTPGAMAVRTTARVFEAILRNEVGARWSVRENAWLASPSKVVRFLEIIRSNEKTGR